MESRFDLTYIADVIPLFLRSLLLVSVFAFSSFCALQDLAPVSQSSANSVQSKPQSLCNFVDLSMGNHKSVRVAAVAEAGTGMGVLSDPDFPSRQPVWFELALKSQRNRTELANRKVRQGSRCSFRGALRAT